MITAPIPMTGSTVLGATRSTLDVGGKNATTRDFHGSCFRGNAFRPVENTVIRTTGA